MLTQNGRVYSYIRLKHLILLACLISIFFAISIFSTNRMLSPNTTLDSNWPLYDVPWFITAFFVWTPAIQRIRYRHVQIQLTFEGETSCFLHGDGFDGKWNVSKKSPCHMAAAKVLAPILSLMVMGIIFMAVSSLVRDWSNQSVIRFTNADKANAVIPIIMGFMVMGLVVPMWSFWKYPFVAALRQDGKLLSVQW